MGYGFKESLKSFDTVGEFLEVQPLTYTVYSTGNICEGSLYNAYCKHSIFLTEYCFPPVIKITHVVPLKFS